MALRLLPQTLGLLPRALEHPSGAVSLQALQVLSECPHLA